MSEPYTFTSKYNFEEERAKFLAIADALRASAAPLEFRARLLTCTDQPWHSYDLLALTCVVTNAGEGLSDLMSADLDFDGVPT